MECANKWSDLKESTYIAYVDFIGVLEKIPGLVATNNKEIQVIRCEKTKEKVMKSSLLLTPTTRSCCIIVGGSWTISSMMPSLTNDGNDLLC